MVMKILFLDYDDMNNPYAGGGQAMGTRNIASRLSKKNNVTIVTGNYPGAVSKKVGKIYYKRIGIGEFGPAVSILTYYLLVPIAAMYLQKNFDVVLEGFTAPFGPSFVPWFCKKPLIAITHFFDAKMISQKYKIFPFHILEKFLVKRYENFICFTKVLENKVLNLSARANIRVIPGGVDKSFFLQKSITGDFIFYFGRVDMFNKALDVLLKSVWHIKKITGRKIKLLIAGSGKSNDLRELKNLINHYDLKNEVKYIGKVEGAKKLKLLSQSKFVAYPTRFETFGYVALETLAAGKLLICFDIEGFKWIPKSLSLKIKNKNYISFADAILKSLNHKYSQSDVQKRRKFAKKFSWKAISNKYEKFIYDVSKIYNLKLEEQIRKLLRRGYQFYFISPHLDDAVFSAGQLLSLLQLQKSAKVINVFTRAGDSPYTLSSKRFLKLCGYADAESLYKERIKEDKQVFRKLGISSINLGYSEALFRKKKKSNNYFSAFIPEIRSIYPTYYSHVVGGRVSKFDANLEEKIAARLKNVITKPKVILFCPLGVGRHVDHIIVRRACEKLDQKIIYWWDFPYSVPQNITDLSRGMQSCTLAGNVQSKEKLMRMYKSQVKAIFGKRSIIIPQEKYFFYPSSFA